MQALTIARYSLKKASRDKVFYLVPLVTIVALALLQNLQFFDVGVRTKVLKDFGLAAVGLFGFFIALVTTITLVPFEKEQRTAMFVFSKPVPRYAFVAGKFLCVSFLLTLNLLVVGGELAGMVRAYSGSWDPNLFRGLYLIWLKLNVFAAFLILVCTTLSLILTMFAAVLGYAVMHAAGLAEASLTSGAPPAFQSAIHAVLSVIPDLTHFDSTYAMVHGYEIPAWYMGLLTAYSAIYVLAFLAVTTWIVDTTDL